MVGYWNKPELRLLYGRLITDISIKLGADLREKNNLNASQYKIGASSLMKAQFGLVDGVWTKPGVDVVGVGVEGAAHFMPPSSAVLSAFMTDFWTFQAYVMDNLSKLRAQYRDLMARHHLDEMIKSFEDSEDED
ncbi:hypothetical protein Fot_03652 [Forsythia ovata]|uniref:Uncharacterized protein n=1 Tax=Forsythia ovata TaxID=205694 RepID=A0ABD1XAA7_9LAMI